MRSSVILVALSAIALCEAEGEPLRRPGQPNKPEAQNVVPGEYIVHVEPGYGPNEIKKVFNEYSPASVTALANTPNTFLIKLANDPGLAPLEAKIKGTNIKAVQPNFVYRINPSGPQ